MVVARLKVDVVWEKSPHFTSQPSREALTAFGRGECYVEQYLDRPRDIEAQVIADEQGHVVVVGLPRLLSATPQPKTGRDPARLFSVLNRRHEIASAAQSIATCRLPQRQHGRVFASRCRSGVLSFLKSIPVCRLTPNN
ncbi:ATP-binding protein [Enterobacter hormaechei]